MAGYDLYGFVSDDIDRARIILESALGIQFDVRESDYQGGNYFQWRKANDEHFVLKRNLDPFDHEPVEMSFPTHQILFYVNDTPRSQEFQAKINQGVKECIFLRHEDL